MKEPFFSIVIPTFNRAELVHQTLKRLQAQTTENFECVIVDDGGEDETKARVDGLSDDRFRYFWKPNGERGAARNFGARRAVGRYIYFLDSDDWLMPDALRRIQRQCESDPPVIVSRVRYQLSDGSSRFAKFPYGRNYRSRLLHRNLGGGYVYLRRDVAEEVQFFEHPSFSVGEDWDLALRLAVRYPFEFSAFYDRVVLLHDENTMGNLNPKRLLLCANILESSLRSDSLFVKRHSKRIPHIKAELTSLAALEFILQHDALEAARSIANSFRLSPGRMFSRRGAAVLKHAFLQGVASSR